MTSTGRNLLALSALLAAGCGSGAAVTAFQAGAGGELATGGATSTGGRALAGDTSSGGDRPASGGALGVGGASPSGGAPTSTGGAHIEAGGSSSGGARTIGTGGETDSGAPGTGGRTSAEDSGATHEDTGGSVGCECTSGPCCDGCSFRPFGFLCSSDEVYASHCVAPTYAESLHCPDSPRVANERRNVFCSGASALCNGRWVHSKETEDPCPAEQYCHEGSDAGSVAASCIPGCKT